MDLFGNAVWGGATSLPMALFSLFVSTLISQVIKFMPGSNVLADFNGYQSLKTNLKTWQAWFNVSVVKNDLMMFSMVLIRAKDGLNNDKDNDNDIEDDRDDANPLSKSAFWDRLLKGIGPDSFELQLVGLEVRSHGIPKFLANETHFFYEFNIPLTMGGSYLVDCYLARTNFLDIDEVTEGKRMLEMRHIIADEINVPGSQSIRDLEPPDLPLCDPYRPTIEGRWVYANHKAGVVWRSGCIPDCLRNPTLDYKREKWFKVELPQEAKRRQEEEAVFEEETVLNDEDAWADYDEKKDNGEGEDIYILTSKPMRGLQWVNGHCRIPPFDTKEVHWCLQGKTLLFSGDSQVRFMANLLISDFLRYPHLNLKTFKMGECNATNTTCKNPDGVYFQHSSTEIELRYQKKIHGSPHQDHYSQQSPWRAGKRLHQSN